MVKLNENERISNQWWQKRILNNEKAMQLMKLVGKHPFAFEKQINSESIVVSILDDILNNVVSQKGVLCPLCSSIFYKKGNLPKSNQLLNHFIQSCSKMMKIWSTEQYQILPTCNENGCQYVATSFTDLVFHKSSLHGLLGTRLAQHIIFLTKNTTFKKLKTNIKFEIFLYNSIRIFFLDQTKSASFGTEENIIHTGNSYCIANFLPEGPAYGLKMKRINKFFKDLEKDNSDELESEQIDPDVWKILLDHDYVLQKHQHQYNDDFQVAKRKIKCCIFCAKSFQEFESLEQFFVHISTVHLDFLFPTQSTCPWRCPLDPTECPARSAYVAHLITAHKSLPKYLIKFICSLNSHFCGSYFLSKLRKLVFYIRFHGQLAKQETKLLVTILHKAINKKQDDEDESCDDDSYEAIEQELFEQNDPDDPCDEDIDHIVKDTERECTQVTPYTIDQSVCIKSEEENEYCSMKETTHLASPDICKVKLEGASFPIKQEKINEDPYNTFGIMNPGSNKEMIERFQDDEDEVQTCDTEKDPLSIEDEESILLPNLIANDLGNELAEAEMLEYEELEILEDEEEDYELSASEEIAIDIIDDILASSIEAIETQFYCIFCGCMLIDFNKRKNKYEHHLAHHHFPKMIFECKIKLSKM